MNWKTTLFGLVAGVPQIIEMIIPIVPEPWGNLVSAIALIIAFYYAKDKNVTSTGK